VAPLADQVFDTLREWIINGQLPPGYRLRVRDLAEAVGTSVMPVREAIRRLVDSGLAVHEPYKGASVRALEVTELEHIYAARTLLEGECARLGALAASPSVADRMEIHWDALQHATRDGHVTEALRRDEELLGELYTAAGNDVLFHIIRGLWDKCRPYKIVWASQDNGSDAQMWRYKPALISAVRENDATTAETIIRTSYQEAKAVIRAHLRSNPAQVD
jgi:DNA-binding GntR family transcriptional regulator